MCRRFCLIALSLMLILPLGGCWDIKYLDQLSIVVAIGADTDPNDPDRLVVTLQTVVPSQASETSSSGGGGGSTGIPVTNYTGRGKTLLDAFQNTEVLAPRRLYFSHNQMMIIGEDLAKKGLNGLLDLPDRDPEIRIDFGLLVAKKGTAADILNTLTSMEKLPVKQMYGMIQSYNKRVGGIYYVKVKDFLMDLESDQVEPAIGTIEFVGDPEEAGKKKNLDEIAPMNYLRLGNMAVFSSDKLAGYLNRSESQGLAILKNKIKRMVVSIPLPDGKAHLAVLHNHASIKTHFRQGKPELVVNVKQKAAVFDVDSRKLDVSKKETIQWLESEAEKVVAKQILNTMDALQNDYGSDAIGVGESVYKANPKFWKKNKTDWEKIFPEIKTHVKVDIDIYSTGVRDSSYQQHMK